MAWRGIDGPRHGDVCRHVLIMCIGSNRVWQAQQGRVWASREGCKGGMCVCDAVLRCACHVWYGKTLIGRGMGMCVGIWWACV